MNHLKIILMSLIGYFYNNIVTYIPSHIIRKYCLIMFGGKIGHHTRIDMCGYIGRVTKLNIGNYTHINRGCILQAFGGITIGNSVSISHRCNIISGGHDVNSPTFEGDHQPIVIGDYVWIGVGATILKGVTIGKGAVVAAGYIINCLCYGCIEVIVSDHGRCSSSSWIKSMHGRNVESSCNFL